MHWLSLQLNVILAQHKRVLSTKPSQDPVTMRSNVTPITILHWDSSLSNSGLFLKKVKYIILDILLQQPVLCYLVIPPAWSSFT